MSMKYILLCPDRIIDKIIYQIYGTLPKLEGEEIRFGAGDVKVINGDSCRMVPYSDVMMIVFEDGFTAACNQADTEAGNQAAQFAADKFQNLTQYLGQEPPYVPPAQDVNPHDYI